jgi:hypothetical protein
MAPKLDRHCWRANSLSYVDTRRPAERILWRIPNAEETNQAFRNGGSTGRVWMRRTRPSLARHFADWLVMPYLRRERSNEKWRPAKEVAIFNGTDRAGGEMRADCRGDSELLVICNPLPARASQRQGVRNCERYALEPRVDVGHCRAPKPRPTSHIPMNQSNLVFAIIRRALATVGGAAMVLMPSLKGHQLSARRAFRCMLPLEQSV